MLLYWGPMVLPQPLLLAHLLQATPDLSPMVWVQITEATAVGKNPFSVFGIFYKKINCSKHFQSTPGFFFSPSQCYTADPCFCFSTECNSTLSIISGWHGMYFFHDITGLKPPQQCKLEFSTLLVSLQTEEQALQRALEMSLADSRQTVQQAPRWVNLCVSYYQLDITHSHTSHLVWSC